MLVQIVRRTCRRRYAHFFAASWAYFFSSVEYKSEAYYKQSGVLQDAVSGKYESELARGAAHIASALHEESLLRAVRNTIQEFEAVHGPGDLKTFVHSLLWRLELRGKAAAATLVQDVMKGRRMAGTAPGASSGPVSLKSPTGKLEGVTSKADVR